MNLTAVLKIYAREHGASLFTLSRQPSIITTQHIMATAQTMSERAS